jgi:hypothetical protein
MKQHVHMFESFISYDGPSSRERAFGSDKMGYSHDEDEVSSKRVIAARTAKLIGELTRLSNEFDMNEPEVRVDAAPFMQKYLSGRGVSEEDTETFLKILAKLTFRNTSEKKKVDQDGDGDMDFVDAKVAQYTKGGIPKSKAIAKAKMFAKKNNIADAKKSAK